MTVFDANALSGRTALVTGATGGIGAETCRVLARMGASVVATGRREPVLRDLASDLSGIGPAGPVTTQPADITDPADRERLVATAESTADPLDVLVNAAGVGDERVPFEQLDGDRLDRVLAVNFTATVALTQLVYRHMRDRGDGSIVNVSSLSGLRGTYRHVPYTSSKFALTGFTQSLALEAIEHGVRVNAVCPGWVDTEMGRAGIRSKAETNGVGYEEQLAAEREAIPSGRITEPDEVAATIGFLATDAAPNVVGESIKLSGGAVLR